jgi:L-ascorbate metabolism protein UlaG (beta-lactamase superfamily)
VSWAGPKRIHLPGIAFEDLPHIDVVLVSHNHYDHMDKNTLIQLHEKFKPVFLVGLGDKAHLESWGIQNVTELDWWESLKIKDFTFNYTPAQHFSGRTLGDRYESLWGGFMIQTPENKNIYFVGDTGYASFFKDIQNRFKNIDVALIPIGAYEPRWFMKNMHVNPEEAVLAHIDLKSKKSFGMHFGTFQLTAEKLDAPSEDLKSALRKLNVPEKDFIAPQVGSTYEL